MLNDRATDKTRFMATRADLGFGANSQLRAAAEVFAGSDQHKRFIKAFARAWNKA